MSGLVLDFGLVVKIFFTLVVAVIALALLKSLKPPFDGDDDEDYTNWAGG